MPVVEVEVDADEAELAADALWQAGPSAVSEVVAGAGRVRLTADVADIALVASRWRLRVVEPDSDAYVDAWRNWAVPQRAGRGIVIQPAWLDHPTVRGDLVVRLDPGRSFGSGSHPSTRLALAVLEDRLLPGASVLDVGCGSGVLAITACRLGAATAVAVDLDPAAVSTTVANAARNGVADRVRASTTAVADLDGEVDLLVANIGAAVLRDLAPSLVARVVSGGLLVLAGLLEGQADAVVAAVPGCIEEERRVIEGWAAVVLRR